MSNLDFNLENYNFDDLLNLFKIDKIDNRSNVIYKLDTKITKLNQSNIDDYIIRFFKKAKNVILVIRDLLSDYNKSSVEIESFMNKIYKIDKSENIDSISAFDLLNKITNLDIERENPIINNNENDPYYNVNKMDYNLKNTTNLVFNVDTNELSPGELNSIKRITQLLNLNINSCFRHNYYQSNPTNFLYNLPVEIKNVSSMRLVSIEIPNSWYLFSSKKKNNIFNITVYNKEIKKKKRIYN